MKKSLFILFALCSALSVMAQSNIQTYTPSKLLSQGQYDVKIFNNLYTQSKFADGNGKSQSSQRENYFTTTVEALTGVSSNNRINAGVMVEFRSNTGGGQDALSVFEFNSTGRSGITTIAPMIKFQPLNNVANFSIQSSLQIPTFKEESNNKGFLDQKALAFQNKFFYDHSINSQWQLFGDLTTEYHFGNKESFAHNTFVVAPGLFLSYFPSSKSTILVSAQHYQRVGDFTQDFTSVGAGAKYQVTDVLNLEILYTKFVRGTDSGLGETFNLGARALF